MPHLLTRGELVQTMLRDFDAHRRAIRAHDSEVAEATWEACEQWVSQLSPETELKQTPSARSGRLSWKIISVKFAKLFFGNALYLYKSAMFLDATVFASETQIGSFRAANAVAKTGSFESKTTVPPLCLLGHRKRKNWMRYRNNKSPQRSA